MEAEPVLDAARQLTVEHAQHHRHRPPPLAQPLAQHEAGLDVDEIVAGQHGNGGGGGEVGRVEHGGLGGVTGDDGHPERGDLGVVAATFVAIDHDHLPPGRDELLDDLDPHRAQPDDDDVPAHRADPALPERALDAPADQQLGDEGEHDRGEDRAATHEADGVDAQPRGLGGEVEVAVADGGLGACEEWCEQAEGAGLLDGLGTAARAEF